jgi:multidrug efflux pump
MGHEVGLLTGEKLVDASVHIPHAAAPILMTSIAFCAGVVPLILGGAGGKMRRAMGIAGVLWHGRRDAVHFSDTSVLRAIAQPTTTDWCCNMRPGQSGGAGSSHNPSQKVKGDSDV